MYIQGLYGPEMTSECLEMNIESGLLLGAGNQSQAFWKRSQLSELLNHFTRPHLCVVVVFLLEETHNSGQEFKYLIRVYVTKVAFSIYK